MNHQAIIFVALTWVSVSFNSDGIKMLPLKHTEANNTVNINSNVLFSCGYTSEISVTDDDCIPDNFGSFTTDNISVAVVLTRIMTVLNDDTTNKIIANFIPYECTFPQPVFKALTKRSDSTRYILYTKKQLAELTKLNTNWVAYSIFAHEIGHHLYLHSLSNPRTLLESRQRELEADYFSGYILRKLTSTLQDAQSGINAFTNHPTKETQDNCTHPCKKDRLNWVKKGFDYVDSPGASISQVLKLDILRNGSSKEQLFNKTLSLYHQKDFASALMMLEALRPQLEKSYKADYFNNRGLIKRGSGDINGAILDFTSAIDINENSAEFFLNRAETKKMSSEVLLKAESKEDFKEANRLRMADRASKQL